MTKLADHIIFIGFMGAGKSTIARRVAREQKMASMDMDVQIARLADMSIPEIFASEGEAGFRKRESDFIGSLPNFERMIISCGGGAVTVDSNRQALKQMGTIVYLQVGAQEAVSRISRPESRPLLSGAVPPQELLQARLALYEDAAEIVVDTSGRNIYEVTRATVGALKKQGVL